jgi:hypothetical protein
MAKLVIRDEQMAVFRNRSEADFRRRLRERFTQIRHSAGLTLSDDDLADQLDRALASGRRFFSTERDLARYAEIVLTRLGGWSNRDHPRQVIDLLASRAVAGARRLDNLEHWIAKTRRVHA